MRTIGDLERWLKQDTGRKVEITRERDGYHVKLGGASQRSKSVEGALENCLEELRRSDSGVGAMRDGSKSYTTASSGMSLTYAQKKAMYLPQTVTAACGTVTAAGGVCPQCNRLPRPSSAKNQSNVVECTAGHPFPIPLSTALRFAGLPESFELVAGTWKVA